METERRSANGKWRDLDQVPKNSCKFCKDELFSNPLNQLCLYQASLAKPWEWHIIKKENIPDGTRYAGAQAPNPG